MPQSSRTYTYTLVPAPENVERVRKRAEYLLGWACDGDTRITCHQVTGAELGVVTLNMTIKARDRWWAAQLAQDIIDKVVAGITNAPTRVEAQSEAHQPHDHRGYAHGRTKRHRDRRPAQPPNAEGA